MGKYGESDCNEHNQHDEAASAATARTTAAKTKTPLEPAKGPVEKDKFKQTRQTSLTIAHGNLLDLKFEHSSLT
jgi:hypothetical protein